MKCLDYKETEERIKKLLLTKKSSDALQNVVDVLYGSFDKYSWVGIYLVKGESLILGPWRGKQATEHITILIGTGVCGTAAKTGETERVDAVLKDPRYLSCFLSTRSEIVVPIKKKNVVIGEIDIDSDLPSAFDKNYAVFLERIADHLSKSMK